MKPGSLGSNQQKPLLLAFFGRPFAWSGQHLLMVQYYFKPSEGPNLGPIDAEEFRQRQEAGEITDQTMVWRSGMGDWTTCASMRAQEQLAAQPKPPEPPRLPKKTTVKTPAVPAKGFLTCGMCGQDWPETLLTLRDDQKICGNCLNRKIKEDKDGRPKSTAGQGVGAWVCMIIAIVCAGCLYYKVSHYGIGPPMKAKEFTEKAKYGR